LLDYGHTIPIEEQLAAYDRVNADSVAACTAAFIRPDRCAMLVMGPARLRSSAKSDFSW